MNKVAVDGVLSLFSHQNRHHRTSIPFGSCTRHRSFCQIRPHLSFHTDIVIEITWLNDKERWFNSLYLQINKFWKLETRILQSLVQDNSSFKFVTQWNWVKRIPMKGILTGNLILWYNYAISLNVMLSRVWKHDIEISKLGKVSLNHFWLNKYQTLLFLCTYQLISLRHYWRGERCKILDNSIFPAVCLFLFLVSSIKLV